MKKSRRFFVALFSVFVACCVTAGVLWNHYRDKTPWYDQVSLYHVLVKSFADTDGDGKGDLKGLISKLDYIKSLNVNAIYLMPVSPAKIYPNMPRSQFGYEVTDFKNINPEYGTLKDFDVLVKEAHKRGIRIILDFVTTVFSVDHPFFKDILTNPDSPYKDWIITADSIPPGNWMNFNDYKDVYTSRPWKPLPFGGYYYALWGDSPFLDYHNPKVREYILSVADFWLDRGADGFRIDATKHLFINGPGPELQFHQPENLEFWKNFRRHMVKKYGLDKALIGESIPIPDDIAYVLENHEMFDMMMDPTLVDNVYPHVGFFATDFYSAAFFHSVFGNEPTYQKTKLNDRVLYHSDHDGARFASRLRGASVNQLKMAASILFFTPSHVKIFAGDEIGIKGVSSFDRQYEKFLHSPLATMAWNADKNGGFSTSDTPVMPITDDYERWNVASQDKDPKSLLNHYRTLMKVKNEYARYFFKGRRDGFPVSDDKLYAYFLSNGNSAALVVINFSEQMKTFKGYSPAFETASPAQRIFGPDVSVQQTKDEFRIGNIPPLATVVFEFKSIDTALLHQKTPAEMKREYVSFGDETVAKPETAYRLQARNTEEPAFVRLFKGQGKVSLRVFEQNDDSTFVSVFSQRLDTENEDIVVPLMPTLATVIVGDGRPVRFKYELANSADILSSKLKKLADNPQNTQLKAFWAGKDENFWYLKIDKGADYALPLNAGLDYIIFLSEKKAQDEQPITFWRLPPVVSDMSFSSFVRYQRHIRSGSLQMGVTPSLLVGTNFRQSALIYETKNAFYAWIARDLFPDDVLYAAPFVWSAKGAWGDTPPFGKPVPVIERLTAFPDKEYDSDHVADYLEIL